MGIPTVDLGAHVAKRHADEGHQQNLASDVDADVAAEGVISPDRRTSAGELGDEAGQKVRVSLGSATTITGDSLKQVRPGRRERVRAPQIGDDAMPAPACRKLWPCR